VLVGMLVDAPEKVQAFGFVVIFPLTFASNAFVPTATMPGWLQGWVKVNPVTLLSDALPGLLVGGDVAGPALGTLAWAGAIAAVFAPLALWAFRRRTS
jgi:oleandomycin transport system permease protein